MSFIITTLIMFAFWILLSGEFTFILILSGVIFSCIVSFMCHDFFIGNANIKLETIRILKTIRYLPWLMWQIFLCNIDVVKMTFNPNMPISPTVISFDPELKTDMGIVTLANSITLTPGTVTITGAKNKFLVHAITESAAESLMEGEMQRRVRELEGDICV